MMRKFSMALVLAATFATLPALAQSGGGGSAGDNSEVKICQTRLEQEQLRAQALVDPTRQNQVAQSIEAARQALAAGNPTKCLVELQKIGM